jgi:hypothetical protein
VDVDGDEDDLETEYTMAAEWAGRGRPPLQDCATFVPRRPRESPGEYVLAYGFRPPFDASLFPKATDLLRGNEIT